MKKSFWGLVFLLLFVFNSAGCGSISNSNPISTNSPTAISIHAEITLVGNSGFLITVGDNKVLIDALYEAFEHGYQIPPTVMESLMNATPPFDNVDLILATHKHADHFSVKTVRRYLEKYPEVKFASTAQITSMLTEFGDRIITLDAKVGEPVEVNIDGIEVEAIYLSHGVPLNGASETINNAYVAKIAGVTIFQTGDVDPSLFTMDKMQGYHLADKNIDVALIQHYLLSDSAYLNVVNDLINSSYLIPIHYEYNNGIVDWAKIKEYYPDAVYFAKEKQTWKMP